MHLLKEEGKLSIPHARRRRGRASTSRLVELGRSEWSAARAAHSSPSSSNSSDETGDEVKQRRRATAQALVSLSRGIPVSFTPPNPLHSTAKTGTLRLKRPERDSSAVGGAFVPSFATRCASHCAHPLPIERSSTIAPSLARS